VLLLDNSAWSRVVAGTLPREASDAVAGWLEARELRDYNRIAELTSLSFESVWVAPSGSI
jgi:hypothetical protein